MDICNNHSSLPSTRWPNVWRYKVFVSFRGGDVRGAFVEFLYEGLADSGIIAFIDHGGIEIGGEIMPAILQVIEHTEICIPIFSKDFASSKSCLKEVEKMVECDKIIMPIFYDVSPSVVGEQKESYRQSFCDHEAKGVESATINNWKKALKSVSRNRGWELEKFQRREHELIKEVVSTVRRLLRKDGLYVTAHLVGMDHPVQEVLKKLDVRYENGEVIEGQTLTGKRVVEISGLPGIGKSTLATVVYKKIRHLFEGFSFLNDIHGKFKERTLVSLQEDLISDLQKKRCTLRSSAEATAFIKFKFRNQRVLIVLDDVSDFAQINSLAKDPSWFGPGSRIIIISMRSNLVDKYSQVPVENYLSPATASLSGLVPGSRRLDTSRRRSVVNICDDILVEKYQLKQMNDEHAFELFCKYALGGKPLQEEFSSLARDISLATGGLPSVIQVVGSSLFGKPIMFWEKALDRMKRGPFNLEVERILKRTYEPARLEEDMIEAGSSIAIYSGTKRRKVEVEQSRQNQERKSNKELEDSQESKIMELLELGVNDIRIVGIHGRDGIGKTTLAKIVYDQISLHFDACSFLAEIEETTQQPGGVQYLQTKLIFDILKREFEVASAFKGVRFLKEISRNMKVLIVLDDVEKGSLLKEFVGTKLDWFGSGSRIIVTSKQKSILQGFVDGGMARTYDVSPMDDNRAFDLFWQYAMGMGYELHPYVEIANKIVKTVEGLPLLVKVFGSFLHGKGQDEWIKFKDLAQQFQEDYQKILSIVYEALDQKQKQMYLDIACFLPDVDCRIASYMWHDYDCPHFEIEVLRCMSLIEMEENKIGMHSILRCLARKIIYKGFHDPGTRVRFYIPAIAHDTKKWKRGTYHLNTIMEGFEILPSTTFLSLGCANVGGRFADALLNVRWLHWQGCPQDFEAISIRLGKLVILDLSWSKVTESWGGWKGIEMERLKVLNLTGCVDLLVTPSFSCYPNLEILILERCSQLVHLDPSINDLKLLVTLNLKFCSEFSMLPVEMDGMNALKELLIDGTSIRVLPASIGKLAQLQILSATNCFSLVRVPGSVLELTALSVLALDDAKILELPESIGYLRKLRRLSLRDCHGLGKLPESIGELADSLVELDISGTGITKLPDSTKNWRSLKVLKMDSCFVREFPCDIGHFKELQVMDLSDTVVNELPSSVQDLRNLKILKMARTFIREFPEGIKNLEFLEEIDFSGCRCLTGECDIRELSSLRVLLLADTDISRLIVTVRGYSNLQNLILGDGVLILKVNTTKGKRRRFKVCETTPQYQAAGYFSSLQMMSQRPKQGDGQTEARKLPVGEV